MKKPGHSAHLVGDFLQIRCFSESSHFSSALFSESRALACTPWPAHCVDVKSAVPCELFENVQVVLLIWRLAHVRSDNACRSSETLGDDAHLGAGGARPPNALSENALQYVHR